MTARALSAAVCLVLSLAGPSACALAGRGTPVVVRYFSPERKTPRLTAAETPRAGAVPLTLLTLGEVAAGTSVQTRIAYRVSGYEIGYYEDLRWAEPPATYVRRELGRVLFEEGGFTRALADTAPVLDVEVQAFEELKLPDGARAARVQLYVRLLRDDDVLLERTFAVDRTVAGPTPTVDAFVAAMSTALDDAVREVAAQVARALLASPGRAKP